MRRDLREILQRLEQQGWEVGNLSLHSLSTFLLTLNALACKECSCSTVVVGTSCLPTPSFPTMCHFCFLPPRSSHSQKHHVCLSVSDISGERRSAWVEEDRKEGSKCYPRAKWQNELKKRLWKENSEGFVTVSHRKEKCPPPSVSPCTLVLDFWLSMCYADVVSKLLCRPPHTIVSTASNLQANERLKCVRGYCYC